VYYANIEGIDDSFLEFLGYDVVVEGDGFKIYRCYNGDEHIVSDTPPRYMMVEDVNDALIIKSKRVLQIPVGPGSR
jgi:hypothetical protein